MSSTAWTGAAVAGVAVGYALVSRRLAVTPVSTAMVFVACGVLLGPVGLDLVNLQHDSEQLRTLVEAALTLVLFTDATTVRPGDLRGGGSVPGRLRSIGLVLTIGTGWLLAWPLLLGLSRWELALVGAVLAPTDAALGKSAISDPRVPSAVMLAARYGRWFVRAAARLGLRESAPTPVTPRHPRLGPIRQPEG